MEPLIHLAVVDSTQAFLRRNPQLGFCTVLADGQTEGRGRQGNAWVSPLGAGLWMSAALPPHLGQAPGLVLQRAMGAVARVLDPLGQMLGLKWPNDLVAWKDGQLVKVGGITGPPRAAHRTRLSAGAGAAPPPDRRTGPSYLKVLEKFGRGSSTALPVARSGHAPLLGGRPGHLPGVGARRTAEGRLGGGYPQAECWGCPWTLIHPQVINGTNHHKAKGMPWLPWWSGFS